VVFFLGATAIVDGPTHVVDCTHGPQKRPDVGFLKRPAALGA